MTGGSAAGAGAGALGVAAALAVGELAAGVLAGVPSPVDAVGQFVVDGAPGPLLTSAIATLGAANRSLLALGTVLIALFLGAATAVIGHERPWLISGVFAAAAVLGTAASAARHGADVALVMLVMASAAFVGHTVLRRALPPLARTAIDAPSPARAVATQVDAAPGSSATAPPVVRRRFLRLVLGAGAAVLLVGAAGRWWLGGGRVGPASIALPAPNRALPPLGTDLATSVAGVSPAMTPIDGFFRIDTALGVPRLDPETWRLRIHGRVDREVELTYDELLALPLREVDVTIACVSNEVGGDLVGTARWLGVALADVLALAGVRADAEQLLGRSADGWTAGFPVALALDGRDALVAVGMQGEALPAVHGFPARLVVPGLYGYVSATKWLTELELTAWDGVDGYWIPRGWAKEAPIKTSSRIDVPRARARVPAGDVVVAGVAWAPTRGISRVEVAVDEGSWVDAKLVPGGSKDTWVQWRADVALAQGPHRLTVRATDGVGAVQSQGPRPPAPDGAEGWHEVSVSPPGERLELHTSRAELDIWRDRWVNGVAGDAFLIARINEERVRVSKNRDSFNSSEANGLWHFNAMSTDEQGRYIGGADNISTARVDAARLRDAAFHALLTQDAAMMAKVGVALPKQPDQTRCEFVSDPGWAPGAAQMIDANTPGFSVAHCVVKHIHAYSYFRIAVQEGWVSDLTSANKNKLESWYRAFAEFCRVPNEARANVNFVNRPAGDYTLKSSAGEGWPHSFLGPNPRTFNNGTKIYALHDRWNNRSLACQRVCALVGVMYNDELLLNQSYLWLRDWLRYGVFPDGGVSDNHRAHVDGGNKASMGYIPLSIAHALTSIDALARLNHAYNLYEHETTIGALGSEGAPSAHGGGPESTKSVLFAARMLARYGRYQAGEYGGRTVGSNDVALDFRGPYPAGSSNFGKASIANHDRIMQAAIPYAETGLIRDWYRGTNGQPVWEINGNGTTDLNDAWAYAAPYLQWAGLADEVFPYPAS